MVIENSKRQAILNVYSGGHDGAAPECLSLRWVHILLKTPL